jgi:Tol biopolymer transport system component
MNADGSGQRNLTNGGHPAWSPDGGKIAFNSSEGISVMNADGTGRTNLTNGGDPDWSPDGSKITFTRYIDGRLDIFVMNADGSGQTNLTNGGNPDWSPDGAKIAFTSNADIFVMNTDGSGQTKLTDNPTGDGEPDWQALAPPPPPSSPPPTRCVVPRVLGLRLGTAKRKIRQQQCSVGRVRRAHSRWSVRGRVIRQSPRPGTVRRRAFPVNLVVGRG